MIRKNNIALGFNSSELSVQWRNVLWVSSLIVIEERSENRLAVQNMVVQAVQLQGGKVTLVLALPKPEGYPNTGV